MTYIFYPTGCHFQPDKYCQRIMLYRNSLQSEQLEKVHKAHRAQKKEKCSPPLGTITKDISF
jgi:hypothetical protein